MGGLSVPQKAVGGLVLSLLGAFLTYLVLRQELDRLEFLTLLTPPFLLTLSFSLIFYFFPNFNTLFTLVILGAFFAIFYSGILAGNIFSAAAAKNLLLLKPAQTTFLFVILTIFFLLSTHIFKIGFNFILQYILSFLLAYLLAFLVFWTQTLNKTAKFEISKARQWAFMAAVTAFLSVWGLTFLRLEPFFRGLVQTAAFNAVLGVYLAKQSRQLTGKVIFEYLLIPALALGFSIVVS